MNAASAAPQLPFPPTVLGIAGCSGSGKTTLASELARLFGGLRFPLDDYYRDLGPMPLAERILQNFDDPAAIEIPLLAQHLAALARGEAIGRPVYDFASHTRLAGRTERIVPGRFLIVEGIFALHYEQLLPLYHLRIFVETPDALCFERRLQRDRNERGRSETSVRARWENCVRPSGERFVRPSAAHADLLLDGTGALDWKVERVMAEMQRRGLLIGAE